MVIDIDIWVDGIPAKAAAPAGATELMTAVGEVGRLIAVGAAD
jgi:hypothetical protein